MPSREDAELGALLRSWRERALLTQEELAARAGLDVRTIRRFEAGEVRRPRTASVRSLAEALELDTDELSILTAASKATLRTEAASPPARAEATNAPTPPTSLATTPPTTDATAPTGAPMTLAGGTSGGAARVVPRQMPAGVPAFVGRARELAALDEIGATSTTVVAIDGMAGVGKTALAVHAAHRLATRFPDGDLFVDLHGHTQGMPPADPADSLARLLGALGVPADSLPGHVEDRAALYRTVLAERKMLIVLDNAADEAQVRPLLPGAGGCSVLVTSRRRLAGLDDARTVPVDVLPLAEAIALFSVTAGHDRVAGATREELAEVVRRCGLLPLAIRLAAARLKAHPAWDTEHLLSRLEEHRRRLGELQAGRRSVIAALDLSYRDLTPAERQAYRLLGRNPGADIASPAAAALLDTSQARAARLLDGLLEVHLLQEPVAGRYRFHDLVRAHAADRAAADEHKDEWPPALARLLDHHERAASAAMDLLYPYEADTRPRPSPGRAPISDAATASAWLAAELANILPLARQAAGHGLPVRHLSATLHRGLQTRGHYADAERLHRLALQAARAAADRPGELEALLALGEIRGVQGEGEAAIEDLARALAIARETGHHTGRLRAMNSLATVHMLRDELRVAGSYGTRALRIARCLEHRTGELDALVVTGYVHRVMGRHRQCVADYERAIRVARSIGHHTGELRALMGLGNVHLRLAKFPAAGGFFARALELARAAGHRGGELGSLTALGHLHRIDGRYDEAHANYRQAAGLAREIGDRNQEFEAVHALGRLSYDAGHHEQALEGHRRALALAVSLGQQSDQARAHDGLARAHNALGREARARHHWTRALIILRALGIDRTDERGVDVTTIGARLEERSPRS